MEKLRTPLMVNAIYLFILGLSTLTPSLTSAVFGYEVKDPGVLRVLSGLFFGFSVLVWSIASNTEKYGGLASAQVIAIIIGIVFLLWGWVGNLYTARNALVPLVINIVLAGWIWSAKPRA